MLFYEPLFLFVFLPVVFNVFVLTRRHAGARAAVLLIASLFFYLWSEPRFVPVVLATCWTDHAIACRLARPRAGRHWLAAGILINVGMLAFYKYAGFGIDNLDVLLGWAGLPPLAWAGAALPIGVSFIVFEKITYLVDVARGISRPAPSLPRYLLYVFLFPKLLAGPIIKYHEMEVPLRTGGRVLGGDMARGFSRFMLGVVKKVLIADTLGGGADAIFGVEPQLLGCADAWWGVGLFTFQIYIDFSGYSDMAIGLALMFGFGLRENFNHPYISRSVTEFWRRWHISLSTWIREYLYIPLGGNRVSPGRQYANLWVCFLASGLWHGAAWTYVVWGAYNGFFLMIERLFLLRWLARIPPLAATACTFLVTMIGWAVFRAPSLPAAGTLLAAMASPGLRGRSDEVWRSPPMVAACILAAGLSFVPLLPFYADAAARALASPPIRLGLEVVLLALFLIALATALASPFKPFLYFRF